MSPWIALAWIILAALYICVCAGLWLVGKALYWPDWLAPAVGVGALIVALLFSLMKKMAAPRDPAPSVAAGTQMVTPAMAALMPPRELARRWDDLLPFVGKKRLPVFLAVGEDDALRNRLWLSTPECRYIRDDASGLAFALFPDSLWIDVPSAYVSPPAGSQGIPSPVAGPPGLWEELVRFLPRLPGHMGGVLIFVDSCQPTAAAAGASQWLAVKLDLLGSRLRKTRPVFWIVATRLERFPGGRRLIEKMIALGDAGRALLGDAFGAVSPGNNSRIGLGSFTVCSDALDEGIAQFINACDSTGQGDGLSSEAYLLRSSLPDIVRNAKTACEALGRSARAGRAFLGGVFLCGGDDALSGLAFGAALARTVIPGGTSKAGNGKPRKTPYALTWLLIAIATLCLGVAYVRAKEYVDAVPFHLLEVSPNPGGFGGAPPVARYARARKELDSLAHSRYLTRRIFHAPNHGVSVAEELYADHLKSWLPATDEPALINAWLDGLAEWAEGQRGIEPLAFTSLSGRKLTRIRGAHGKMGRTKVARLLSDWRMLLDNGTRMRIDLLQNRYDARLYDDWRRKGCDLLVQTVAAAESADFSVTVDFIASESGFAFAVKAGEELDFARPSPSNWARAAIVAAEMHRAAELLDMPSAGLARIRQTVGAVHHTWMGDEPTEILDKRVSAARRMKEYREVLSTVYPRTLDAPSLVSLVADTYVPPGGAPPPPSLVEVDRSWTALAEVLCAVEPMFSDKEGREILELLKSRYTLLLQAATVRAAKQIQGEWEEMVVMPLAALGNDESILYLLNKKNIDAFVLGSAKPFLSLQGIRLAPATALGQEFPFKDECISWINQTNAMLGKLDKEYPVRLSLLPVTVGATARIFPRGIHFTMATTRDPVAITGYNNTVETAFTWSAHTCQGVELAIPFDTFRLEMKYSGALGLPRFLKNLNHGRLCMTPSSFPEYRNKLEQCGIESLTANFAIVDAMHAGELRLELEKIPDALFNEPVYGLLPLGDK